MRSSSPYGIALALSLTVFLLASTGVSAQSNGKKVALVLGNAAYAKIQALRNSANDASDMAAALARMGFTVLSKTDLDRRAMRGLVDDFNKAIQGAEVALFFYSGHGVQMDGENYLVPVNAEVSVPGDVPDECLSLSRITARMSEAGAGTNIIILDACRDNPFKAVSRGIERGLAVVGQKPPESIIVYATAENEKADDGNGRNGVFTAALLKNIERPDSFADVLLDVKAQVRRDTGEKQKPATYENLSHRVYLAGVKGSGQAAAPTPSPVAPAAKPTLSVTRSYGVLTISVATAGTLYLDGVAMGELPAGAEAKLDNIEVGDHSLELRYAAGEKETKAAAVEKGRSSAVNFSWKKSSVQVPDGTLGISDGFVRISTGRFTMGSPETEKYNRNKGEGPVHELRLSTFAIGRYEVTVEDFQSFVNATNYRTKAEQAGIAEIQGLFGGGGVSGVNWRKPEGIKQDPRHPVTTVSFFDTVEYCNWLSRKEGLTPAYAIDGSDIRWDRGANGYRLPTEAEWEYACRAGTKTATAFGESIEAAQAKLGDSNTAPVGQYAPNAWGIYDMYGNVYEWCWDWYSDGYYAVSPEIDPTGPSTGKYRVVRGGSWQSSKYSIRSAIRDAYTPGTSYRTIGIRVARSIF